MDLGPHAVFIVASYAIVAVALIVVIAVLAMDGRRLQRQLEALEARGIRRRSAAGADGQP